MTDQRQADRSEAQVRAILAELRGKLLDLSARNRLLNFRHSRTNSIRAVDELPDQIFSRLVGEGKRLAFDPVREPTQAQLRSYHSVDQGAPRAQADNAKLPRPPAEEWAQHCGINVRYELPVDQDEEDPKHRDDRIQTLFYPDDLEARLRRFRNDARTAIEETGANMLYLAFGFLEWRERDDAKTSCIAPLILVPVELERKTAKGGHLQYTVGWTGEDLQTNLSLQKKLAQDFALNLPDIGEDDTPEGYFDRVRSLVKEREDRRVRRYLSLAFFNFSKLLIYRDLDPDVWPDGRKISGHPLVRRLLLGDAAGTGAIPGPAEAPAPDPRVIDLELALVDRADSSQAAAILQALSGTSLIIQGPPGTGKSQTITNLIAAALADNKSVLFVSEKLAALEVVKRRLDVLGLGHFCLELHSHKTRKQAFVDDLKRRVDLRLTHKAGQFREKEERLGEARDELARYAEDIGRMVDPIGLSVSQILFIAGSVRRKLGDAVRALPPAEDLDLDRMTQRRRDEILDTLDALAHAIDEAVGEDGPANRHPWCGISATAVLPADAHEIVRLVSDWAIALRRLETAAGEFDGTLVGHTAAEWAAVREVATSADRLPLLRELLDMCPGAEKAASDAAAALGTSFGDGAAGLVNYAAFVRLCAAAPTGALGLRGDWMHDPAVDAILEGLAARLDQHAALRDRLGDAVDVAACKALGLAPLAAAVRTLETGGLFAFLSARWRAARRTRHGLARPGARRPPRTSDLVAAITLIEAEEAIRKDPANAALGEAFAGVDTDVRLLRALRTWRGDIEATFGDGLNLAGRLGRYLMELDARSIHLMAKQVRSDTWHAVERILEALPAESADDKTAAKSVSLQLAEVFVATGHAAAIAALPGDAAWADMAVAADRVRDAWAGAETAERAVVARTELDLARWFSDGSDRQVADRAARAERAAASADKLSQWLRVDKALGEVEAPAARRLAELLLDGRLATSQATLAYDHLLFDALARAAYGRSKFVRKFGLQEHTRLRDRFRSLDETLMELRRAKIAADLSAKAVPAGVEGATAASRTELSLIRREIEKQRRHIPIRALVERAPQALRALKPCFMMGPLSVAQYLPPGKLHFDLVIFDEASQIKPEDAIGSLARGTQAIVVGDSNQLPPTTFFEKLGADAADGGDDDDELVATVADSVLEVGAGRLPSALLRWHYRSRHDALIRFSNSRFYDGRLLLFPSPHRTSERYGIDFQRVEDGLFEKGRNRAEAQMVAAAAVAHLRHAPGRSLGVVAMNLEQRNLIHDLVEREFQRDPALLARAEDFEQRAEPFFVKNLENVQGDERDVIMISMTYGPHSAGARPRQNLGPINGAAGWRRLNVLFTRAKEKMTIFSSLREGDIVIGDATQLGPRALKDFLHYAEHGRLPGPPPVIGPRPPDSEFEEAVLEGLSGIGYACEPQLGAAGFFIDIAVRDPDNDTEFLAGIECDGAAYHSERSARDRDRLRQEILEGLGWSIERIWSTDWFRDPDAELERIRQRLEALRRRRRERQTTAPGRSSGEQPRQSSAAREVNDATAARSAAAARQVQQTLFEKLSIEDARSRLVALREGTIKPAFPDVDPTRGLLRKNMLDELLRKRPTDFEEFVELVRLDLREQTDGEQLKQFGDQVFAILEMVEIA